MATRKHPGSLLARLARKYEYTCQLCGRECLLMRNIPLLKHLGIYAHHNQYFIWTERIPSKIRKYGVGTVEHLTPRAEGGSNKVDNVVLACRQCNDERARVYEAKLIEERKRYRS